MNIGSWPLIFFFSIIKSDIDSDELSIYCRYMGFCSENCCNKGGLGLIHCWNVYKTGDILKRKHQYYMNLKKKIASQLMLL